MKQLLLILKNSLWRSIVLSLAKGKKSVRELNGSDVDPKELEEALQELVNMQVIQRESGFGEVRYSLTTHFKKKCMRTLLPIFFSVGFSVVASLLQLEKHRFHQKQVERIYSNLYE